MKTIEKILKYKPVSEYNIELLRKWGFYNGTGTDDLNFDVLIVDVFALLRKAHIFDEKKTLQLQKDIEQLVIRHDIDTWFKIWFVRSNLRLAMWLYRLLHRFPLKYRVLVSLTVFYAVCLTKKARKNYFW